MRKRAPGGGRKPGPPTEQIWTRVRVEVAAAFDERCTARGETRNDRVKALVEADAEGRVEI